MKIIIFLCLFLLAKNALIASSLLPNDQTTTLSYVASYAPSSYSYNFSTADSQAVITSISVQYPQIKGWLPEKGFKKLVGEGLYYEFILSDLLQNRMAAINAFRKNGTTNVVLFDILPSTTLTLLSGNAWNNPIPPFIDGFNAFTNYDNTSFLSALRQIVDENPNIRLYHLCQTDLFASKQFFYFRFLFQQTPSSLDYTELIECIAKPADPTYDLESFISLNLNNNNQIYRQSYDEIISDFPEYVNYKIISVRKQVVYDETFEFTLLDAIEPLVKQVFLVYDNIFGSHTAKNIRTDYSHGYSVEAIDLVSTTAMKSWPELKNFSLVKVTNIRPNKTGLKLFFTKNEASRIVEFDLQNQEETLIIYTP